MTNATEILSVVLLIVGVSLMLVVHVLVIIWALRRGLGSRGTSHTTDEERAAGGRCGGGGLSAGELGALSCHDFKQAEAADGAGGGGDCAVCLEAFEPGDRCRRLPRCEHSFHAECVDSWLRKSGACPVCRTDVVDRLPKGEPKAAAAAAAPGALEMAERRSSPAALGIVAER
ncbi:E3 ubiquitin-protein ligase EL5-like [Panicum miliaceum]|uniref:E3 ubiquitin-protein ligase EL5-like n=1 Tax=Panicum miliaceum TaxID=4540 RepID=A0A3L6S278_PANMI|nr:E3 ubiquitin-protein ligase EL5-like [Panicum miliaceum]